MPKGSRYGGKGRKSRKSRRYARPPAPMVVKPPVGEASVPAARLAPRQATAIQQAVLSYPHVLRELKTIGIISGALLILIIVLSVAF